MVEVNASGPPHVLRLWSMVGKGMLPVNTVTPTKPLFMSFEFHGDPKTVTMLMHVWPPSVLCILPDLRHWCLPE